MREQQAQQEDPIERFEVMLTFCNLIYRAAPAGNSYLDFFFFFKPFCLLRSTCTHPSTYMF